MEQRVVDRKRKRLSKNKKKNWRKTDITDVEEHLEDIRVQERTGGLVAEKSNEQLFFVDRITEEVSESDLPPTRKRNRKPLKCQALLEPDSKIKPFKVKHNVPKPENLEKRRSNRVSKTRGKTQEPPPQPRSSGKSKQEVFDRDLWADSKTEAGAVDAFHLKYTRKATVKPPKSVGSKTSAVDAVEVPHPGQSYNPEYRAHQELLGSALDVEVKQLKEDLRVKRALDDMFPTAANAPTQETWLSEMSAGLGDSEPSHVTSEEGAELLKLSVNPAVRREDKKTEKQRRKERERKAKEKSRQDAKSAKVKKNEMDRLKSLKRELVAEETRLKQRAMRRTVRKLQKRDLPHRLGKLKYTEPCLPLKLTEELEGSLRLLKPEGHLLEDRYYSLQKRNIIEPRTRAKRVRKYKIKRLEKKGHKEVKL